MRAREFIINIPINVKIEGDDDPQITTVPVPVPAQPEPEPKKDSNDSTEELPTNFIPPLQQKIELMKKAAGKDSEVIDQLTADEDEPGS